MDRLVSAYALALLKHVQADHKAVTVLEYGSVASLVATAIIAGAGHYYSGTPVTKGTD